MAWAGKVWERKGRWWCVQCVGGSQQHPCQLHLFFMMHPDGCCEAEVVLLGGDVLETRRRSGNQCSARKAVIKGGGG